MKLKCPSCGFKNEEGSKFCKNCNEPLFKQGYSEDNPYTKKKGNEDQPFELISDEEADEEVKVKNEKKERDKSPLGTGCLVFLVIIVGIFLIYFLPAIKKDSEMRKKPIAYVSPDNTIERAVEKVAIEAFGKTVNWDSDNRPNTIKKMVKFKQASGPDEGGYLIEVHYRANENLTVNLMRSGIFLSAIENKVNWENITNDMFERILREEGQLWLHPAIIYQESEFYYAFIIFYEIAIFQI